MRLLGEPPSLRTLFVCALFPQSSRFIQIEQPHGNVKTLRLGLLLGGSGGVRSIPSQALSAGVAHGSGVIKFFSKT